MHGKGTLSLPNGDVYSGEFVEGKRDGEGECKYNNGERYVGMWRNEYALRLMKAVISSYFTSCSIKEGRGVYFFNDGRRYEGSFVGGEVRGQGECLYPNGDKYVYVVHITTCVERRVLGM